MNTIRAAAVVACALAPPLAFAQTNAKPTGADDWPAYNRTYASERFSPLAQITSAKVVVFGLPS
jgi:glucose dehydrogenase